VVTGRGGEERRRRRRERERSCLLTHWFYRAVAEVFCPIAAPR